MFFSDTCCLFYIIRQLDLNCKLHFLVGSSSFTPDILSLFCFESAFAWFWCQRVVCIEFGDSLYVSLLFPVTLHSFIAIGCLALVFWFPSPDSLFASCTVRPTLGRRLKVLKRGTLFIKLSLSIYFQPVCLSLFSSAFR